MSFSMVIGPFPRCGYAFMRYELSSLTVREVRSLCKAYSWVMIYLRSKDSFFAIKCILFLNEPIRKTPDVIKQLPQSIALKFCSMKFIMSISWQIYLNPSKLYSFEFFELIGYKMPKDVFLSIVKPNSQIGGLANNAE